MPTTSRLNQQSITLKKIVKIGFLVPYSSIHPQMSNDIIDGIRSALPEKYRNNFQFIQEYIHLGNTDLVKTALNKLIQFHNVDMVSGIVSYQLIPEISDILRNKKKLGFFFDFGEYIPPLELLPDNLFFNSQMMWQQEYALGRWAQQTFKGKGAMLMSVYDAGFHLHSSFWQGAISAEAEEIDIHTIPFNEGQNLTAEMLPSFLEKIEKSKIDFLHPVFCGNEALDFFNAYRNSSLNQKIPLVVSPHMASEEILQEINNLSLSFYSASGWDYYSDTAINQAFKKTYEFNSGKKATVFAAMGYETGLALQQTIPDWDRNDFDKILQTIKTETIEGPRQHRNFSFNGSLATPNINIEKINLPNINHKKTIIAHDNSVAYNHNSLLNIHYECVSGWKNPYLCI